MPAPSADKTFIGTAGLLLAGYLVLGIEHWFAAGAAGRDGTWGSLYLAAGAVIVVGALVGARAPWASRGLTAIGASAAALMGGNLLLFILLLLMLGCWWVALDSRALCRRRRYPAPWRQPRSERTARAGIRASARSARRPSPTSDAAGRNAKGGEPRCRSSTSPRRRAVRST